MTLLWLIGLCVSSNFKSYPVQTTPAGEIALRECLVIRPVGRGGRVAVHTDAIEAQIVAGTWKPPKTGDTVALPDGKTQTWEAATAGKDGWFTGPALNGGYAYAVVDSPAERVMILEAAGHNMVYVNGEPRMGDPYSYGYLKLPVLLKRGPNHLLFQVGRGRFTAKLVPPRKPIMLDASDATLPDLMHVSGSTYHCGLVLINATSDTITNPVVESTSQQYPFRYRTRSLVIRPYSIRKIAVPLMLIKAPVVTPVTSTFSLDFRVRKSDAAEPWDIAKLTFRIRKPSESHKITFVSAIDNSIQYYALQPAPLPPNSPALFLSLHGASVEAIGQADAYSAKSWGHIVCPTNRRPYGFDWEDWGRLDAMEVLNDAIRTLKPDPSRIYLTGHSMGGHGAWQVGVTYPDKFAAVGPSAGWISFWSYAGGSHKANPTPMEAMLQRAANPSDTMALVKNLTNNGVYILHGANDDNVPPSEARTMAAALKDFHHDWTYFEQPNAGHWWDNSDEPGADCVDWAPMFDLFARHTLPADSMVRNVDFTTMNPAISAKCHWATINQQQHSLLPSAIHLRFDPLQRRISGTTENVARLDLDLRAILSAGRPISLEIDGAKISNIPWPADGRIHATRTQTGWSIAREISGEEKNPVRCGPFKEAFQYGFMLVYGTKGSPEENAWAFAKARYDAEQWYYRGNGATDVIQDTQFLSERSQSTSRSVILYGNADTNAAWRPLLGDSPVQINRTGMKVGSREIRGDGLACLFVRPRPGSGAASVAAVSGTGIAGMRLTDRLPYFVSGVAYPDVTILGPETLSHGVEGVRCAGFFGNDWRVESGDWAWNGGK